MRWPAHRATGVPISTTLTPPQPWGLEQQRILAEEGVDLTRAVIGHCGGTLDTDYHLALAANGFSSDSTTSACRESSWRSPSTPSPAWANALRRTGRAVPRRPACKTPTSVPAPMQSRHGRHGVLDVPLRGGASRHASLGISDDDVTTMLVGNPRRILEVARPTDPTMALLQTELPTRLAGTFLDQALAEPGRRHRAHDHCGTAFQPAGAGMVEHGSAARKGCHYIVIREDELPEWLRRLHGGTRPGHCGAAAGPRRTC